MNSEVELSARGRLDCSLTECGCALAGSPAQSTPTEVVLEVLDVNEHAPEFLVPNPHVNATHNIHLSRRTPVGRVLMKVCHHALPR